MVIPEGYKKTEVGIIPEDWDIIDFEQVGVYFKGKGISMRDVKLYGKPCIMYGDIYVKFDTHFYDCDYYVDDITASKSIRALPQDLFFTASGETAEDIGRCVSYLGKDAIYIGGDIIALRPHNQYDSLFLSYVQNSHSLKRQKAALAQGNSVVHISTSNIQKTIFACPRKKQEQINISSVLYDVDNTIDNLEKLVEKKKNIKQGAMQELLTGKRRLPGFDREWIKTTIDDSCTRVIVGLATSVTQYYRQSGTVLFRNLNIKPNYLDDRDILYLEESFADSNPGKVIHANDVLTVHTGYVGISCVVPERYEGALSFTTLISTTKKKVLAPQYLAYHLNSNLGKTEITNLQAGGGRNNLNVADFKKYQLIIPKDIKEQTAIVTILSDMDNEIDELEKKLAKYRCLKQGMMSELLTGHIRLTEKEGA